MEKDRRILVAGLVGTLVATLLNEGMRWAALAVFDIPDSFKPLNGPTTVVFTLLGGLAGTGLLWWLIRRAQRPWRVFLQIATGVLVVSLVPDLLLMAVPFAGATWTGVSVLMTMHVVAFACVVGALSVAWHRSDPAHPSRPPR